MRGKNIFNVTLRCLLLAGVCLFAAVPSMGQSQRFFNLTVDDIEIDSLLPEFTYSIPLGRNYADSTYELEIRYPDFIEMSDADIRLYNKVSGAPLPELPEIRKQIVVDRKNGSLEFGLVPIVEREGKKEFLVSFMIAVSAYPKSQAKPAGAASTNRTKAYATRASEQDAAVANRYADHSKLASGRWVKIRVPSDGVYQLTDALIRQCGFSDPSKVRLFGYGGHLENETLVGSELKEHDDVPEVPTCTINGRRLFYGRGPVSWSSATANVRTRNPYSNYGYYFLSDIDGDALTVDSAAFVNDEYIRANDYHSLHEVDNYAWYQGGRKLFENDPIAAGESRNYAFANSAGATGATLAMNVTAGSSSTFTVAFNGKAVGSPSYRIRLGSYDRGNENSLQLNVDSLGASDTVTVTCTSGGPLRLDYVSMTYNAPRALPDFSNAQFPVPEYVYAITNQDHHADPNADLVIIIPTSQKLLAQAQRLAAFHEQYDSMTVNIVPADELYNEFSSGTPDAGAYRRYLKMMYDRATTDDELPKSLLLFGDCVWDNRLLSADVRNLDADDYLLCYESENSYSLVYCYVDDGWLTLLDDGEGGSNYSITHSDKEDMGVGRFPVTTESDAKILVDKVINYKTNRNAGGWQNTLMFLGDDGNSQSDGNMHMEDVNRAAEQTSASHPGYLVKKVMWDAYTRVTSATGNSYPEVTDLVKKQQAEGALIFDYAGHGSEIQLSHEAVLRITDFANFTNTNLPLWVTASCDIMPYDGTIATIGETSMLNQNGGSVAFFGTTRTVFAQDNTPLNIAFMKYVLDLQDGKPITLGEAQRLTKNQMISGREDLSQNKLQYALLGDPAMSLNLPTQTVVVDSINGISTKSGQQPLLRAGSVCRVKGHVENNGQLNTAFTGLLSATVRDTRELVVCRQNNYSATDADAFEYYDRTKTLYSGNDSVREGQFSFAFAVPRDINYSEGSGLMNLYAVTNDRSAIANGYTNDFLVNGSDSVANDSIGPSIYCYLNSPSFVNGGDVNTTPYFVANVTDKDGINSSGSGIGHDLELIIDGEMSKTYNLNSNFSYDFGSYTSGSTFYSIPELAEGRHQLLFRAWDIMNNSSTATLDFNVVNGLSPNINNVSVTNNPASTSTTFIVTHNFAGANVDVIIDVFDMSGRLLWQNSTSGTSTGNTYTVDWDLTLDSGQRLQTGVYLYRVRLGSGSSKKVSKAKKLIVINNN